MCVRSHENYLLLHCVLYCACVFSSYITVAAGLSSAVAGGVAGSVVAVFVIIIIAAICYWRSQQLFSLCVFKVVIMTLKRLI